MKTKIIKVVCPMLFFSALTLFFNGCGNANKSAEQENPSVELKPVTHLDWSKNAVIYEANIRQYSPGGTFGEFEQQLPRLKKMGVDILWLMPIFPIGEKNRKGGQGSYYSVMDYTAVNPEHGTMEDFKNLVKKIHEQKMHVILDWVANHSAWDNKWATEHPDFYTKDSLGNFVPPVPDWADVIDFNYDNKEMRKQMIEAMKFWIKVVDVDGFRCDVAEMVPTDFWNEARAELDKIKPVFMLAEAEKPELHTYAFDMTYGWEQHFIMNEIYAGKKSLANMDSCFDKHNANFPPDAFRMYFTSNHDENSWKGSEYERMGDAVKAFAILSFTVNGMPLIYTGQEAALDRKLKFFDKDTIDWKDYPMENFYSTLCSLKKNNKALQHGTDGGKTIKLKTSNDKAIYAFEREKEGNEVVVILNLSKEKQRFSLVENPFSGTYNDVFANKKFNIIKNQNLELKPWDYLVLVK